MKSWCAISVLIFVILQPVFGGERPAGKIVWWGRDVFWTTGHSDHTNGVVEVGDEILTNAVGLAAWSDNTFILRSDGTVVVAGRNSFGAAAAPLGLSNVVSVSAEGGSAWAVRRDGTVVRWGEYGRDDENIVAGLSNVTAIAWAGHGYLALRNDGTVLGFRLGGSESTVDPATGLPSSDPDLPRIRPVKVRGQVLNNVVALASMGFTPLVLKNDGTVLRLGYHAPSAPPPDPVFTKIDETTIAVNFGGEFWKTPYEYSAPEPVRVDGQALTHVATLANGGGLALRSNGTVAAWSGDGHGQPVVPSGLSNITAIAGTEHHGLALKRDGTVAAWGDNYFGQASVPAGLSNVIAIAGEVMFSMAITTGAIPASVFIRPHGRLEEIEREADLIFKGCVISSSAITNKEFPLCFGLHSTIVEVLCLFKGDALTNRVAFLHNTQGPGAWSGGTPPPHYRLEAGRCYLIFAENTETPGIYKQLARMPAREDEGATLAADGSLLRSMSIKEAHWFELNRLLTSSVPADVTHAIVKLNAMSERCGEGWGHSRDFSREAVLNALQRTFSNTNNEVAIDAIGCFRVAGVIENKVAWSDHWSCSMPRYPAESNCVAQIQPYANTLIQVAMAGPPVARRAAAVAALYGTGFSSVSNSLSRWLRDSAEDVRVEAVRLLRDYPGEFAEQALRERATDTSAKVRSVVADVIGEGQFVRVLPTLVKLFGDPVGKDSLLPPLTMEYLRAGQRWNNIGDVHTSAGFALVKFDADKVADVLKRNLDDPGFHINFISKLAEKHAEPWLSELIQILETRLKYVEDVAKLPPGDPRRYAGPESDIVLIGTYGKCWEDVRQYLLNLPKKELSSPEMDHYMDLLESMVQRVLGCAGCSHEEVLNLYALYQTKGLAKRAGEVRQRFGQSDGWRFDEFDRALREKNNGANQ